MGAYQFPVHHPQTPLISRESVNNADKLLTPIFPPRKTSERISEDDKAAWQMNVACVVYHAGNNARGVVLLQQVRQKLTSGIIFFLGPFPWDTLMGMVVSLNLLKLYAKCMCVHDMLITLSWSVAFKRFSKES
jgi:hypothetical protein